MDRYDGKLVKNISALETAMIHLMPKRTDAEVYFQEKLDVTDALRWGRETADIPISMFSIVLTALGKMLVLRPKFNRFIQGQRLYERKTNTISFVCKTKFEDESEEALIVLEIHPEDTIQTLNERLSEEIRKKREGEVSGSDSSVQRMARIPWAFRVVLFRILRLLDYFGANLSSLTSTDPTYCSILVSNLGSIGLPVMYHHLNNYGTNSCVVTLGKIRKEEVVAENGSREWRDILEIGATVDERIADGFYFAQSVKLLKQVLARPELLMQPLSEKVPEK